MCIELRPMSGRVHYYFISYVLVHVPFFSYSYIYIYISIEFANGWIDGTTGVSNPHRSMTSAVSHCLSCGHPLWKSTNFFFRAHESRIHSTPQNINLSLQSATTLLRIDTICFRNYLRFVEINSYFFGWVYPMYLTFLSTKEFFFVDFHKAHHNIIGHYRIAIQIQIMIPVCIWAKATFCTLKLLINWYNLTLYYYEMISLWCSIVLSSLVVASQKSVRNCLSCSITAKSMTNLIETPEIIDRKCISTLDRNIGTS